MKSPERNERFWPEADSCEIGGLINSHDQGPLELGCGSDEAPTL